MSFKSDNDLQLRKSESYKIIQKYSKRIPIIIEKNTGCLLNDIDKKKYLVPDDLTMNQFMYIIRKRVKVSNSQSIFFLINNKMCPSNTAMRTIYDDNKDEDGFLYIIYTSENTFG